MSLARKVKLLRKLLLAQEVQFWMRSSRTSNRVNAEALSQVGNRDAAVAGCQLPRALHGWVARPESSKGVNLNS
jgi:hypothetical protein